jgi:hypothetical protein
MSNSKDAEDARDLITSYSSWHPIHARHIGSITIGAIENDAQTDEIPHDFTLEIGVTNNTAKPPSKIASHIAFILKKAELGHVQVNYNLIDVLIPHQTVAP